MITTEEIAIKVYNLLNDSEVKAVVGEIDYERNDYTVPGVVIIPHTIDGEGSIRFGQIKVNIHVPDIPVKKTTKETFYRKNLQKLIDIRKLVIAVLERHYEYGEGYNWTVGQIDPPIKEQGHDEHFVSIALDITVRNKKQILNS